MAITLITKPEGHVSVYDTLIIKGTTTRYSFNADGSAVETVIWGFSEKNYFLKIMLADSSIFEVNDTIFVFGASDSFSIYNGKHQVTYVSSDSIETSTPWGGGDAGDFGYCRRINYNLYIRAYLDEGLTPSKIINANVVRSDTDGVGFFSFDIAPLLRAQIPVSIRVDEGAVDTSACTYQYPIVLDEIFSGLTGWMSIDEAAIIEGYIAHNIYPYKPAGWMIYNNPIPTGSMLMIRAYVDLAPLGGQDIRLNVYKITSAGENLGILTYQITNSHIMYNIIIPNDAVGIICNLRNHTGNSDIIDNLTIPVLKTTKRMRWLYCLNRFGGWSTVLFHDYELIKSAERIDKYICDRKIKTRLYGYDTMHDDGAVYADLITSSKVYNEDLRQVYVTTQEMTESSAGSTVDITIEENYYQAV